MAEHVGTSQSSINRWLKNLEDLGFIEMTGRGKRGHWKITEALISYISDEHNVIQKDPKLFRVNNNYSEGINSSDEIIHSEYELFRENNNYSEGIKIIQSEYPSKEETKEENKRKKERGRGVPFSPSLPEPKSEKSSIRKTASMINMLSDVAKIPAEGNWVILEDLAKWLVSQEIEPAQIGKHYGRRDPGNGVWWWYRDFWKGKKGEYPEKPTDIRNTILKAVEFEPLLVQQVETKTTGKAADATQRAIAKLRAQAAA